MRQFNTFGFIAYCLCSRVQKMASIEGKEAREGGLEEGSVKDSEEKEKPVKKKALFFDLLYYTSKCTCPIVQVHA